MSLLVGDILDGGGELRPDPGNLPVGGITPCLAVAAS